MRIFFLWDGRKNYIRSQDITHTYIAIQPAMYAKACFLGTPHKIPDKYTYI